MYNRTRSTVDSGRRAGISPSGDDFLRRHGNENITQFTISRSFLNPLLTGAIGIIRKIQDTKLFHLHVLIRTGKTSLSLDKNAKLR
jgi:hypothetical protein